MFRTLATSFVPRAASAAGAATKSAVRSTLNGGGASFPAASATATTTMMPSSSSYMLQSIRSFSDAIKTGTCKWFDAKKGFGFIVPDEEGVDDVFVHQSAIHAEGFRSLADGEPLEYTTTTENGRLKAENVTGPMGAFVQGQPKRMYDQDGGFGRGGGGFGRSSDDDSFGGGSRHEF